MDLFCIRRGRGLSCNVTAQVQFDGATVVQQTFDEMRFCLRNGRVTIAFDYLRPVSSMLHT